MRALIVLAALSAEVSAGCGECRTVVGDRRVSGSLSFRPGDGLSTLAASEADIWEVTRSSLTLKADLTDGSAMRYLSFAMTDLSPGRARTFAGSDGTPVCISQSPGNGDQICLPFVGVVDVRALSTDCWQHESGAGMCADTLDVSVRGTAASGRTEVDLDIIVTSNERWTGASCSSE